MCSTGMLNDTLQFSEPPKTDGLDTILSGFRIIFTFQPPVHPSPLCALPAHHVRLGNYIVTDILHNFLKMTKADWSIKTQAVQFSVYYSKMSQITRMCVESMVFGAAEMDIDIHRAC